MIKVQDIELGRTNTENEPQEVSKFEKLNLKKYLHLKIQLIHNLEQLTAMDDQKCFKPSDMRKMVIQEIDLLKNQRFNHQ